MFHCRSVSVKSLFYNMEILEHDLNQTRIIIKHIRSPRIGDSFKYQCLSSLGLYTAKMEIAPSLSYEICLGHSWNFRNLGTCMLSHFSRVQLFETLRTVARQGPLSVGFSRQESWSGLPFPPPGNLPNTRIEPTSLLSPALAVEFFTTRITWETPHLIQRITVSPFFLKVTEAGDMKVVLTGETHQHRH